MQFPQSKGRADPGPARWPFRASPRASPGCPGRGSLGRPGQPGEAWAAGRGPGSTLLFYSGNCIIYQVFTVFYHLGKPPFRGRRSRIISLILVAVCENRVLYNKITQKVDQKLRFCVDCVPFSRTATRIQHFSKRIRAQLRGLSHFS